MKSSHFTKKYVENSFIIRNKTPDRLNQTAPIRSISQVYTPQKKEANSPDTKLEIKILSAEATLGKVFQEKLENQLKQKSKLAKELEKEMKDVEKLEAALEKIIQERDKNRDLYTNEVRQKMDTKITIESQKRQLENYFFVTENPSPRTSTPKIRSRASSGFKKKFNDLSFDKNQSFNLHQTPLSKKFKLAF